MLSLTTSTLAPLVGWSPRGDRCLLHLLLTYALGPTPAHAPGSPGRQDSKSDEPGVAG